MDVTWQNEIKWLSEYIYKPDKEKWEGKNNCNLGNGHWSAYVSKYAELRRKERNFGNSLDSVNARTKRFHPTAWSWAMDWYNRQ